MSEPRFLKCSCAYCGGHIEFPAHGVGMEINCPHCGQSTLLAAPALPSSVPPPLVATARPPQSPQASQQPQALQSPQSSPATATAAADATEGGGARGKRGKLIGGIVGLVVVALIVVAGVAKKIRDKSAAGEGAAASANTKPTLVTPPPEPEPPPPPRVPGEDLQVLKQQIQKAEQGSLRYVSGVVTNHGDRQFFNVKVEYEMLNAKGQVVGNANDYLGNLAPHAAWNFRAQILDRDAAKPRLTKLTGEKE
ncbi:hypothetical protein LBMAG56_48040 [Verrucomicrobiota bacterium]|nr:hypothetical protein LBMAG56_48040 [Verrucomicrobiota bacterium]